MAARGSDVDLLVGSNLDEGSLYLAPLGGPAAGTDQDVLDTAALFHRAPGDVVRDYRVRYPAAGATELRTLVLGDGLFRTGTRAMATAHAAAATGKTYCYEFGWRSDAIGGRLGASHVMELPFVFDNLALPALRGPRSLLGSAEPPAALATRIHRSWITFAATGDPGWPAHSPGGHVERLGAP